MEKESTKTTLLRASCLYILALLSTAAAKAALEDALTFEVFQDNKQEYRWRLKNAEVKVIATLGQGY